MVLVISPSEVGAVGTIPPPCAPPAVCPLELLEITVVMVVPLITVTVVYGAIPPAAFPPAADPAATPPAAPPFDDPDADLILRSSDGVEFGVMKAILKVASPIFRDMFTIGSPTENTEIPVIHLAEDSRTLEDLLRFCYPIYTPMMFIPEDVGNLYQAADKYNIQGALEFSADTLRRLSAAYPMAVYAVACRLRLEDVATLAAQASLNVSLPDLLQDQSPSFQGH